MPAKFNVNHRAREKGRDLDASDFLVLTDVAFVSLAQVSPLFLELHACSRSFLL